MWWVGIRQKVWEKQGEMRGVERRRGKKGEGDRGEGGRGIKGIKGTVMWEGRKCYNRKCLKDSFFFFQAEDGIRFVRT